MHPIFRRNDCINNMQPFFTYGAVCARSYAERFASSTGLTIGTAVAPYRAPLVVGMISSDSGACGGGGGCGGGGCGGGGSC